MLDIFSHELTDAALLRLVQSLFMSAQPIKNILSLWKNKNMSIGDRLILLKFVMSYPSVCFLLFFKAPTRMISSI